MVTRERQGQRLVPGPGGQISVNAPSRGDLFQEPRPNRGHDADPASQPQASRHRVSQRFRRSLRRDGYAFVGLIWPADGSAVKRAIASVKAVDVMALLGR